MKKICIISDAWHPQINGVVRTLQATVLELEKLNYQVTVIGSDRFKNIAMPGYSEICLALRPRKKLWLMLTDLQPDYIHIATEGPLGFAARRYCLKHKLVFTTSYHTRFPEYVAERLPLPLSPLYRFLRRFHNTAAAVMVPTKTIYELLNKQGFKNLFIWSRGVDTNLFQPDAKKNLDYPRPIYLYVGRLAPEKNLEDFLKLKLPGTKLIVGQGPQQAQLQQAYPDAVFVGLKSGAELAQYYAGANVFVFPSKTDTFGLVILEALAAGVPVAAYPVPGPLDIMGGTPVDSLNADLQASIVAALQISSAACRNFALTYSWPAATQQFLKHLLPVS